MLEDVVEGHVDRPVSELQGVQEWVGEGLEEGQDKELK